ncbi:hypothetical protein [Streptomyces sp. NPDC016626]|uniref:hypothetical protein n=1 Tax=Streptomyces sp. NPDC016626 TaxID=3364968 RepID=UPI0036F88E02
MREVARRPPDHRDPTPLPMDLVRVGVLSRVAAGSHVAEVVADFTAYSRAEP